MSCRRAFDLDLADFVAGSARPEWAEFRAHYARCAECSAEVRAWTELHLLLQPPAAHPAEELLLRFETERDRLPAAERRAVQEHLAHCVSCNDELAALRRFDFTALEPRAAAVPAPRPSFAERLRRLVLHPAFAYAIVLLLLYPALEGRLPSRGQQAAREDRQAVADRPAGKSAQAAHQKAQEPAAPANLARSENDAFMHARREEAAPALGGRLQAGETGGAERAERLADEKARIESESLEKAERYAETRAATPEPAGWKALALSGPGAPVDVAARDLGTGLVLTLTVPDATRAGDVEVRVLDARGGREMRERFARAAESVAMHLPAAWLTPGTYTAELRRLDAGPSSAEVFSFRVVP
jgi:hypothetical protein